MEDFRIILRRFYGENETTGTAILIDKNGTLLFSFHTLELPNKDNQHNISCIPEGVYPMQKEQPNEHFPYGHFSILNVPERSGILMHIANYVSQLRGCLAVGKDLLDMNGDKLLDVNYSNIVLAKIYELVTGTCVIEIKS